jgi:sensor histidine kinase YesM
LVNNLGNEFHYPAAWYYVFTGITLVFLLTLTYVHNLVIIPRLLARRKRSAYIWTTLAYTLLVSVVYTVVLKLIIQYFPLVKIYQITLISVPVSNSWQSAAFFDDIIGYFLAFIVWIFLFAMAWYMNNYSRQERTIEKIQKKQVETELDFLKSQINPHFLFNNLNNLYALAIKKSDKTPDAILKLSALLRYLLYESNRELIAFEKEREVIQAYIDLELLRFSDVQGIHFSVESDREYMVPPLLWLPVLENVFKHGVRIISDQILVDFSFSIHDGEVRIYSRNFYKKHLTREEKTQHGGIGLTNLRKRLELLYPERHKYQVSREGDFYIVDISVWLK